MACIGDQMPRGENDVTKRLRALEQAVGTILGIAGNAAALAQAIQTGLGNLASSGTTWAGPVASPSTVSAAAAISAGGNLSGGDANLSGYLFSPAGRAFQVVTSFASAWFDGTGKLGINTSTVRDKQDFEPAETDDLVEALLHLALIRFRRTELVEQMGDEAPYELGTIAEYMASTPLREWVFADVEGAVQGIEWAHLVIPLIATVQSLDARLKRLESPTA